jgi:hypothetical protein
MQRWAGLYLALIFSAAMAAEPVNLSGKVSDGTGNPIAGAIVTLLGEDLADTTDDNGEYEINNGVVGVDRQLSTPRNEKITLNNGTLQLSLSEPVAVKVELFDVRGNLLRNMLSHHVPAGEYRFDMKPDQLADRMMVVRVLIGRNVSTFRYLPFQNGTSSLIQTAASVPSDERGLAKVLADVDSLRVSAEDYATKIVPISTYEDEVDIVLEEITTDLDPFSFFVTSLAGLQELAGDDNGFGGDLRFGYTGPGAGLKGADSICECLAEKNMPGSKVKKWRAFLSVVEGENGQQVNAADRIGEGPWYDRLGRLLAPTLSDLLQTRPQNGDPDIRNDLPNEWGVPNHRPDPNQQEVDNHHMLTGSDTKGELYGDTYTCNDWTSTEQSAGRPRVGFSWPAGGRENWISGQTEGGCGAGVNVSRSGGSNPNNPIVGSGGGYGGFYCFALSP